MIVIIPNKKFGFNFFTNSLELGINNKIIAPTKRNKLNFKSPFSKLNLSLFIMSGSKPFNPNIDLIIFMALLTLSALKNTQLKLINSIVIGWCNS